MVYLVCKSLIKERPAFERAYLLKHASLFFSRIFIIITDIYCTTKFINYSHYILIFLQDTINKHLFVYFYITAVSILLA